MHATALPHHRSPRATLRPVPPSQADGAGETSFARGRTIFSDGDEAAFFYEIVSGTVRCCRLTLDGRRQIHRFAGPGEMLGLSGEEVHGFSAEAVTAVVVRRHRLSTLDARMAADAGFRGRVLRSLRDELAAVRDQMVLLGRMSAGERIATFLLGLAARAGGDGTVLLPMTRGDIADHLGLTIETVSRKISELKRLGLIELGSPQRIRIVDPGQLGALAEAA